MKRIIGILGVIGTMLFAANSANASVVGDNILISPGDLTGLYTNNTSFTDATSIVDFPVNLYLTGWDKFKINITVGSTVLTNTGIDNLTFDLIDVDLSTILFDDVPLLSAFTLMSTDAHPSPTNHYIIKVSGDPKSQGGTLNINVEASVVPIPAAALLFASGLGFLGFAGRRKRTTDQATV